VVALVLLIPHALVQFDLMGLLAMELIAVGHVFFFGSSFLFFFCFPRPPHDLECWDFLHLRACGLHSSLDELLSELMLYADLVYAESVSSSIIAWR
jgi:hypothetical protein